MMLSLSLSSTAASATRPLFMSNKSLFSLKTLPPQLGRQQIHPTQGCSFLDRFNPLRVSIDSSKGEMKKKCGKGFGPVCYSAPLTRNLQWISTVASVVLMIARGTPIQKSFLVPLLALQAPSSIITWIKGDYGVWTAFLALIVRLFFFIPGELELPFIALLMIIVAPHHVMNLRGSQEGVILSLVIAGFLAFQHFSGAGNLLRAVDQSSIIATLAIVCVVAVPCLFLI